MGTWIVQVDTHMIMPGEPVRYLLDISVEEGTDERGSNLTAGVETAAQPMGRKRAERGAGWYRGDLHCHTHHSDGEGFTVSQLVEAARNAKLDIVFLTDHNTTAGLTEIERLSSEDLLTAGGMELTTFWGHALCLGTREWVDWRTRPNTGDMARLVTTVYANEQVFIIAHPLSTGDPACTGCAWRYGDMMPGAAQLVEVWNGPWKGDSNNEQALALWYDWLNEGLRLVATAGTDAHGGRNYLTRPGFNVIFADALSEAALLKGLRGGHSYLSAGPQVTFQARNARGETWFIGDSAIPPVTLTVTWADCPAGGQLAVIANGRRLLSATAKQQGEYEWTMTPDQADWVVVEIRDSQGEMLVVTNPIFLQHTA